MENKKMKKNFDNPYEKLGGTYREENGRLIPNVTFPEQTDYQIGKYGLMHLDYIKQHRRGRYTTLLTEGKLNARLHEIDLEANEMLETIMTDILFVYKLCSFFPLLGIIAYFLPRVRTLQAMKKEQEK